MDEAGALFAEGKAAMFMHGSWAISIFPESLQEQIGLFHFPYLWGMESQAIAAGYTSGIGISASVAGGREAALALLKELYSTEVQQQIVYKALRLPSMRMNVDYSRMGPAYEGLADLLVARPTFIPYGNALPLPLYELLLDTTDRMIRGVHCCGSRSPDRAGACPRRNEDRRWDE